MREARDRVELKRRKENAERLARGLDELTKDTVNLEVAEMCNQLFRQIEERRDELTRLDNAYRRKRGAQIAKEHAKEEVEKEDMKAWEEGR